VPTGHSQSSRIIEKLLSGNTEKLHLKERYRCHKNSHALWAEMPCIYQHCPCHTTNFIDNAAPSHRQTHLFSRLSINLSRVISSKRTKSPIPISSWPAMVKVHLHSHTLTTRTHTHTGTWTSRQSPHRTAARARPGMGLRLQRALSSPSPSLYRFLSPTATMNHSPVMSLPLWHHRSLIFFDSTPFKTSRMSMMRTFGLLFFFLGRD